MDSDSASDIMQNAEFQRHLRDALGHLYDPGRLRANPLARLFGVADRVDTPTALQRILIEAIDSFEPGPDAPSSSPGWLIYGPLTYRYVEQLSQPEVADQLGLSVRHLRRKEHEALEALANALWTKYGLASAVGGHQTDVSDETAVDESVVDDELVWLRQNPHQAQANLNEVLKGVLELARGLASRYNVDLDVSVPEGLPNVTSDPVMVRQVLLNLLSVGIRRAAGGQISISAVTRRWQVALRVSCDVCPQHRMPALAEETATLNMAHHLAELSGGRLELVADVRSFKAELTVPAVEQLPVLVIDDNADTLQLLQRYATGTRYHLVTTRDQQQAIELAESLLPQVIVLDVMMPGVDGWEVLGRLRQSPATAHIPVVVCTILAQKEIATLLGASDFLRKPISRDAFLAALDRQVAPMETERVPR